jgi:predicted nucleic acid-binding protein
MRYVLDASVAVKWVLPEADSPKALALLDDFRNKFHELIAPAIFAAEIAHALTRAERKNILLVGEAAIRLSRILAYPPDFEPYLPLLPRAVELSSQTRIGVYDCLYVALAEQEQCELVTGDQKLLNSLKGFPIRDLATV